MTEPANITSTLPFIPDLIKEESHPFALFITKVMATIGKLLSTGMLWLNSNYSNVFSSDVIYFTIAITSFLFFIWIIIGMKDVIKEKEFDLRRERSNS